MGELGAAWADKVLFGAWDRVAEYLKRIGHPEWMPAEIYHPRRNPKRGWATDLDPLPQRLLTDLAKRSPMAGDLLRKVVNNGYDEGWRLWMGKWNPKGENSLLEIEAEAMHRFPLGMTLNDVSDLAPYVYGTHDNSGTNDDLLDNGEVHALHQTPPPQWAFDTILKLGLDPADYRIFETDNRALVDYGCGYFGCVMPTHDPNVVMKLTTDTSEALFANLAASLGDMQPPGIVKYFAVVKLRDVTARLDGSDEPVYLLWREEAYKVEFMKYTREPTPLTAPLDKLFYNNRAIYEMLGELRQKVVHEQAVLAANPKPVPVVYRQKLDMIQKYMGKIEAGEQAKYPGLLERIARYLLEIPKILEPVFVPSPYKEGERLAMGINIWLKDYQIAFGDVHEGNVGQDKAGYAIVTDPGLAMEVGPKNYPAPQPKEI